MNPPPYRQAIADYIAVQARPVDKFSHQPRLYDIATELGADYTYDDDVLYAAAWLHDIGVFIGHRPEDPVALANWDNLAYALQKVPSILNQVGFPSEKIPAVLEAIRTHLPSSEPTTLEGTLLRDADILEQLGAIAILRTVSKVGRDTRFPRFSDALRVLRHNAETLASRLRLDAAHRAAEPKLQTLRAFLDAAQKESRGLDL